MRNWFRNLKVVGKLGIGFGACLLLTAFVALIGSQGIGEVTQSLHEVGKKDMSAVKSISDLRFCLVSFQVQTYRCAALDGDVAVQSAKAADEYATKAEGMFDRLQSNLTNAAEKTQFESLVNDWHACKTNWGEKKLDLVKLDATKGCALVEAVTTSPFRDHIIPELDALSSAVDEQVTSTLKTSDQTSTAAHRSVITASLLALFAGLGFAVLVARSISVPVKGVAQGLEHLRDFCVKSLKDGLASLEQGDLTNQVAVSTEPLSFDQRDEIGTMAVTFNQVVEMIRETVDSYNSARIGLGRIVTSIVTGSGEVANMSESVASAAEQSTGASQEIAHGSERLAIGATEAATVMVELTAQVSDVEEGSKEQDALVSRATASLASAESGIAKVTDSSENMKSVAQDGNKAVRQTVEAMALVTTSVKDTTTKVELLNAKSQQISHIVQSIRGIAEQTNLLALNAAIEAARAGEHGRGFAVVADEVRKLSESAASATQEIAELIEGVATIVSDTVVSAQQASEQVDLGAKLALEAGTALDQILEVSKQVAVAAQTVTSTTRDASELMTRVASVAQQNVRSAQEMASRTGTVENAISNVAAISQESAAGAEELTASINEAGQSALRLSKLSGELLGLVERFTVDTASEKKPRLKVA